MAPPVLYRVIYGRSKPEAWQQKLITVRPALLQSYRRHRIAGASYPAIVPCSSSTVRGSVVTGLTEGDIHRLDIFEGSQYDRKKVRVKVLWNMALDETSPKGGLCTDGAEELEAETFVWNQDMDELEDEEWDFEEFKRQKMVYWMGEVESGDSDIDIDDGFSEVDEIIAAEEKDTTGGRGANGAITKKLKESAV